MRTLHVEELSLDRFHPFGTYAHYLQPSGEKLGATPVEFFRDMVLQDLGATHLAAFSSLIVEERERVIDVTEYHTGCSEALMPLDRDILIHVGPAVAGNEAPLDRFRVFRVPRGTLVALRPGVWHHAPFTVDGEAAHILVVLAERTYQNDCTVVRLPAADQIRIEA